LINEVLSTARSLPLGERYPTYLLLDEFQNFVGPDVEAALPEVRQLGIRLILSHQSFSQLERGDYDLTSMIWQAQSRLAFGVQGDDADILGHELASLTYNPKRIKDTLSTTRQRIAGYQKIVLNSWGQSATDAESWDKKFGKGWSRNESTVKKDGSHLETHTKGNGLSGTEQVGKGGSRSAGWNQGSAEHLVPIHQEVQELGSRTFYTGDEWDRVWARRARTLPTGVALVRLVDDSRLHKVAVERSAIGYLGWDTPLLCKKLPQVIEAVYAFIEENFSSEFFTSPHDIEQQTERRMNAILNPTITLPVQSPDPDQSHTKPAPAQPASRPPAILQQPAGKENPFHGEK